MYGHPARLPPSASQAVPPDADRWKADGLMLEQGMAPLRTPRTKFRVADVFPQQEQTIGRVQLRIFGRHQADEKVYSPVRRQRFLDICCFRFCLKTIPSSKQDGLNQAKAIAVTLNERRRREAARFCGQRERQAVRPSLEDEIEKVIEHLLIRNDLVSWHSSI